jgi:hypothetical protein
MNVLKRPYEGDRVAVWAQSDQAKDVCEGALAVVSAQSAQLPLLCEGALAVLVRGIGAGATLNRSNSETLQM